MKGYKRVRGLRRLALVCTAGTALAFGGCNLGEFTTSSTVTLSGREVLTYLVRSALLTPIQTAIDQGIDNLFDKIEGTED